MIGDFPGVDKRERESIRENEGDGGNAEGENKASQLIRYFGSRHTSRAH